MAVNNNPLIVEVLKNLCEKADKPNGFLLPISIYSDPVSDEDAKEYASSDYAYIQKETHDFYEVAIALKGSAVFMMKGGYYPIHENQILIVDKGVIHANGWLKTVHDNALILWISIAETKLRIHTTTYSKERLYDSGMDIFGAVKPLVEEAFRELKTKNDGYEQAVSSYIKALLTFVYRRIESNIISSGSIWGRLLVQEIEEYVYENISAKITLQQISKSLAVSSNYLSIVFKQVRGQNIIEYIHKMKLNKAVTLLHTDLSLGEIAKRLSFADQFHFSKVFKKHMEISPSEYRKLISDDNIESGKATK